MGTDEEGTHERLKAHRRELVDPKIGRHSGCIVKTTGDRMLVRIRERAMTSLDDFDPKIACFACHLSGLAI
jgi:class 3 adenylate cyclase